ncbi:hypothetical protein CONPUDRAFT_78067 [Coniophora puteana RWD-64-598 SS2]|uniref:Uncharacterized protein n=1 Tax=Coniophora puteana (strain RWD-64-598) TaxID=741705 RepID=R7SE18_CONPW|nr:uncharacterized protein CONPUDRAFT_78067 [Coniophora puteana RWD-64-598 SS2]EIW74416.1 hypothetical protein CONPUDRAFT_78067 [Coniophora puteana RWD-64-598 SS2]
MPSAALDNSRLSPPRSGERSSEPNKNYVLPAGRGFSVRAFKVPTLSSRTYSSKGDFDYRPMGRTESISQQPAPHAQREDSTRKTTTAPPPPPVSKEPAVFPVSLQQQAQQQQPGGAEASMMYIIHPASVPDMYIYERSLAAKSDGANSEFIDDDGDSIYSLSTQASSSSSGSSTADAPPRTDSPPRGRSRSQSPAEQLKQVGYPTSYNMYTYPPAPAYAPEPQPMTRAPSSMPSSYPTASSRSQPSPPAPVGTRVRKDSIMLASERVPHEYHAPPGLGPTQGQSQYIYQTSGIPGQQLPQRLSTSPPDALRATLNGYAPNPPAQSSSSAVPVAQGMSRSLSKREREVAFSDPPQLDPNSYEYEYDYDYVVLAEQQQQQRPSALPHRRNSDSDQQRIRPPRPSRSATMPAARSVRWSENLICPSPIPKRKGWFNRRGDQLWTNSGAYKAPPPGEDYPLDLDDYPEPSEGWQNENGVRIDLKHRHVPKAPPRPALKRTNYRPPVLPDGFPQCTANDDRDDDTCTALWV